MNWVLFLSLAMIGLWIARFAAEYDAKNDSRLGVITLIIYFILFVAATFPSVP
jgi:hypothetical protein